MYHNLPSNKTIPLYVYKNLKTIYFHFPHLDFCAIVFLYLTSIHVLNPTMHCYSFCLKQSSFKVILKIRKRSSRHGSVVNKSD